ncbi:hypothetical protein GF407_13010 [candidate division KSB1 bacterium]|nr:hypothetical protein [candidate division KSB1 bacterium]
MKHGLNGFGGFYRFALVCIDHLCPPQSNLFVVPPLGGIYPQSMLKAPTAEGAKEREEKSVFIHKDISNRIYIKCVNVGTAGCFCNSFVVLPLGGIYPQRRIADKSGRFGWQEYSIVRRGKRLCFLPYFHLFNLGSQTIPSNSTLLAYFRSSFSARHCAAATSLLWREALVLGTAC